MRFEVSQRRFGRGTGVRSKANVILLGCIDVNVHALTARARLVGPLCARQLVVHSFVLTTVIASSTAAAQGTNKVDPFVRRGFDNRDAKLLKQEQTRHHIGIQVGIFNPSTDVIELGNLGFGVERSDGLTILRYRYSPNPQIDLVAELRYWIGRGPTATSGEAKVTGGFIGPGIRVNAFRTKDKRVIPYLQGNIYYVHEQLSKLSTSETLYEHGVGFGLSGGVDLEVTRLISFPIEATYVGNGGGGLDDLSGFGVSVGVNINF